jgi:tryptophan-rich sensory protein
MLARYGSLAVVLILVVAASWLAGGFDAGEWYYHDLGKPAWTPAPWMIAIAWALVYVFTALAAWLVWLSGHFSRLGALAWWAMLLVLNVAWSGLFFGLHRIGWAWLELGITLGVGILCLRAFLPLSRQAGYLMTPYLAWIAFLWVLNGAMWTINGGFFSRFLQT